MRLAHKRNVQRKLRKFVKATPAQQRTTSEVVETKEVKIETVVTKPSVALTPKQQQVLDIVVANADGINPKGIGLSAGQEDSKAASWATGALKKLVELELVVKESIASNKVLYKAL
ncbi:MarR family transcriptional regulator [Vibrio gallicus]|uniref:MarR family transcriptional regulator n=1 Tax=Vibrio gallicus TaxID=190897 RepID=UPI0021C2BC3A|nr:MarR family transcriptional regulator [Vibrio gallicus]